MRYYLDYRRAHKKGKTGPCTSIGDFADSSDCGVSKRTLYRWAENKPLPEVKFVGQKGRNQVKYYDIGEIKHWYSECMKASD